MEQSRKEKYFCGKHPLYGYKTEVTLLSNGVAIGNSNSHAVSVPDIDIFCPKVAWHKMFEIYLHTKWKIFLAVESKQNSTQIYGQYCFLRATLEYKILFEELSIMKSQLMAGFLSMKYSITLVSPLTGLLWRINLDVWARLAYFRKGGSCMSMNTKYFFSLEIN